MPRNPEDATQGEQMEDERKAHPPGEDAAERKERLERLLRIARNKERARDYEARSEWKDALRLYTEVLKDDPEDEEAQASVQRTRESLLMQLYAQGMEQLDDGEWAAAVNTFDQLLKEAEQAGLSDYQDARVRLKEAQKKIAPTWRIPVWVVVVAGVAAVVVVLVALIFWILRPGISQPPGTTESPATVVVVITTESPESPPVSTESTTEVTEPPTEAPPTEATEPLTEAPTEEITETPGTEEPTKETEEPATPPSTPNNLEVGGATDTSITLTWSNPGGQTKVVVKRNGSPIAELPADTQRYTDSGLACGSSYPYTILATNEAGESESAPITAQTEACPPPPSPGPTPTGKIAVPVFDTNAGTYNIYIARASDSWQPKLFFQNGSQPAFSPDGRQIILRSWRQAEEGFGQRLVLFPSLKVGAGDERLMTYHLEDAHPSLNRNGEIVFHTRREGSPILVTLGTWPGAESDIANQHKLGLGENPDWLGNRIVYYAPGPPSGLYAMNADGSNVQLALSEPGSLAPAAAPDGDHVAVSLQRGGHWHVFTLSVSQGENSLTQLTNENADDQLPVWSPDGKFIAFVSNRGGKWAVWVMPTPGAQVPADGTDQRKLFDLNGPIDGTVSIAPNMSYGWGEERLSWAP